MPAQRHAEFARRLHRTLDASGFLIGSGRIGALAEQYDVSRETARKWLGGLALPEMGRLIDLARQHNVSFDWLATGRGSMTGGLSVGDAAAPYMDADETRLLSLVRGLSRKRRKALMAFLEPADRSER